jgi:hypothetical protein
MRLVCKAFAKLQAVNSGLFHTVQVTPSAKSLDRLHKISEHDFIRGCVKHISFIAPQLPESFSMQQYEKSIFERLAMDYHSKLEHNPRGASHQGDIYGNLPWEEEDLTIELPEDDSPAGRPPWDRPRAKYMALKYFDAVFDNEEKTRHYSAIAKAIEEQRALCEDGGFAQLGGWIIAKLSQATSASLLNGGGYEFCDQIGSIMGSGTRFPSSWHRECRGSEFVRTSFCPP